MQIRYRVELNRLLPDSPVTCEVGVAQGLFSRDICEQWRPLHHYCVDSWAQLPGTGDGSFPQDWHDSNFEHAKNLLTPYKKKVTFLVGRSDEMATKVRDNHLDILYLDANHSYDGVMKDLQAWFDKVKINGVIAGHDYLNKDYGVFEAVEQFSKDKGLKVHVMKENKDEDAGFYMIKI
jgi:hypothetical protein